MKKHRVLFWLLIAAAISLVLFTSAAYILTRIINQDAVKNAIETTVSKELGGTLTYERVELALFPRPGVVLQKPAITIPGKLSGVLNSLGISPSLLPLLVKRFEIARVKLDQPDIVIELDDSPANELEEAKPFRQKTVQNTLENILAVAASRMPDIEFIVQNGNFAAGSNGKQVYFYRNIDGRIFFQTDRPSGGLVRESLKPEQRTFQLLGKVSCTIEHSELFPAPVRLSIEHLEALPGSLTITGARARFNDLSLTFSGRVDGYLTAMRKAELVLDGTLGKQSIGWIRDTTLLPPELTIHSPLDISRTKLIWRTGGAVRIQGTASIRRGPSLSFDLSRDENGITIKGLRIKDRDSEAFFTLYVDQHVLDLVFKGNLTQTTLNGLFEHERFHFGWMKGNLSAHIVFDQPVRSTAEGTLAGEGLVIPFILRVPFTIDLLSLRADGKRIILDPAVINIEQSRIAAQGVIGTQTDGLLLDLDLLTDGMGWNALRELLAPYSEKSGRRNPLSVLGRIQLRAGSLETERYTFQAVDADVMLGQDSTILTLKKAVVCGISVPGEVTIAPQETKLDLKPFAQGADLAPDLACLTGGSVRISGSYLLSGALRAQGPQDKLLGTLAGSFVLAAEKGRVYHDLAIIRTVAYLNVTELFRGKYDNIEKDGVPFRSFTTRASLRNGIITFNEAVLKSPVLNIVGRGTIDLPGRTMDLMLLAAPFTTIDAVVKKIPLFGEILGGSLISIPIRIKGPLDSPDVSTLQVSAIGEGLLGMMKRTLTLPFKIIEPIIPKGDQKTLENTPE